MEAIFFMKKENDEQFSLENLPGCFAEKQMKTWFRSSNELTGQEQVIWVYTLTWEFILRGH